MKQSKVKPYKNDWKNFIYASQDQLNQDNVKKISFIDLNTDENNIDDEPLTPVVIAIQDSEDEDFEECGLVSAKNIIKNPFNLISKKN